MALASVILFDLDLQVLLWIFETNAESVVGTAAPVMHCGGSFVVKQSALIHLGIEQPVITVFHALLHLALQSGQGLRQQGLFRWTALQLEPGKSISTGIKRLQELLHRGALAPIGQHIQSKSITFLQQRFDRLVLGFCHCRSN